MPSFRERLKRFWNRARKSLRRGGAAARRRERTQWDKNLVQSLSRARLPSWRQIRHLPEVLSSNDSLRLNLGALLIVAGAAVLGVRFYYAHTAIVPAVGGALTEGVVGTPRSLNPIEAVSNDVDMDLARLMYSRLFTTDGNGDIIPDLVDRYDVSADQKTYTFHLRTDATWHDGKPVTADDIVFTAALIQDPAWQSPLYAAFRDVAVEKADDAAVRFTLKEPFEPFLSELTFGILPQHAWKDITADDAMQSDLNLKPIGSGPFQFDALTRDRRGFILSYTMKRNPSYYRDAPYLGQITFAFYPDYASAVDALRKRDVDSLSFVPASMRGDLKEMSQVVPVSLDLPQYTAVFFNPNANPILKDKDVRHALSIAIDKGRILRDALQGEGHPLDAPPLPGYTESSSGTSFNQAESARILDGLGWKVDPQDGIRKQTTTQTTVIPPKTKRDKSQSQTTTRLTPLRLTLTAVDQPETMAVARIVKDGWAAIGVDVTIAAVPAADIARTVVKPRAYEALLYAQLLGADPDPYPFWHSSQVQDPGLNLAMFSNRAADDAIEAARKASDLQSRKDAYAKFLAILADQHPAAFLYSPTYTYPLPAPLKGFGGSRIDNPSDRFATVTGWYLKTRRSWR